MTRGEFLKQYFVKFAAALAMLGLIVYVISHALGDSVGSLMTIPVRTVTDTRITTASAYLFRDEELLSSKNAGIVDEFVESNSKVGKNVTLLNVCATELTGDALQTEQARVNAINRAIRILEKSKVSPGTPLSQTEVYRAEATSVYLQLREMISRGDFSGLGDREDTLLTLLNQYSVLSGKTEFSSVLLAELKQQKENSLGAVEATLSSDKSSGIFYNKDYVDGYEQIFTLSALQNLNAESFDSLKNSAPRSDAEGDFAAGKLVYGYSWYLAMEMTSDVAQSFQEGERYTVTFPENERKTVDMVLERTQVADGMTLMIFRSDDSPTDFIYYRVQTVHISVGVTQGFYIPETALQNKNGVEGVYVFEESTLRFRRIDIVYRGDGYCIAALPENSDLTQIQLNDILVTAGKNLYDGKVYR